MQGIAGLDVVQKFLGDRRASLGSGIAFFDRARRLRAALAIDEEIGSVHHDRSLGPVKDRAVGNPDVKRGPARFQHRHRGGEFQQHRRIVLGGAEAAPEVRRQALHGDGRRGQEPRRQARAVAAIVQQRAAARIRLMPPFRALLSLRHFAGNCGRADASCHGRAAPANPRCAT